ncbi:hypothetical protein QTP88_021421 [Uroleucon formosanum]
MPRDRLTDLTIGTWNVRSLYRTGALTTVLSDLDRYRLAITAIQEVRWTGRGHLKIDKYTVFYSGGTKHERGVGFIVNDQVLQNVKRFEAINDRNCYLEIQCKWFKIVLINCYGPTEDKDEDQKSEFYENIKRLYSTPSNNHIKIMLRDFNVKIGKEPTFKRTIGKKVYTIRLTTIGKVKIKIKIRLAVRKREEKLFKKQFNIKELENPEIAKNFRENIAQNIQRQKETTEDNADTL